MTLNQLLKLAKNWTPSEEYKQRLKERLIKAEAQFAKKPITEEFLNISYTI